MHKGHHTSPWYILGGGAIGSLWAYYLRLAGLPVVLISRQHPIREITLEQNTFAINSVTPEYASEQSNSIDKLIVCTKAPDTLSAVQTIENALTPNAHVLLLQNGMGSQQSVVEALDNSIAIFAGVVTHGAWKPSKTQVVHAGVGKTTIGALNPAAKNQLTGFIDALQSVALNIQSSDDIELDLLKKVVINCAINPLTAIYQCRNGELNTNPVYSQACSELCQEIQHIIHALGKQSAIGDVEALAREVITQTSANKSSMYQDIAKGGVTEIDFINGYLLQQAKALGITAPINQAVIDKVKSLP